MSSPFVCPVCQNNKCCPANGPKISPVLIVSDQPGVEERNKGVPMVGRMGEVVRTEFGRLGLDFSRMRRTNIWLHEPNENEDCFKHSFQQLLKEAKGKQAILLMGSDVVKYLCKEKVSDVCGLQVTSLYLSAPIIMACINPAQVFHQSHGEIRLTFTKFSKLIKGLL